MSTNVQFDPLQFLIDKWPYLSQLMGYLQDPGPRITQLNDTMNQLRCKVEDINNRIRSAKRRRETPTHEVRDWLRKAYDINEKVSKIQTEHENGTFRWRINRRAEQCLAEVRALVSGSEFGNVATRLPPNGVREVPAELPPTNPTMGYYLSKLREFLQDDRSRIFGIWGMGGVGKTTLLRNLNNELFCSLEEAGEAPPMFDHVIWAVASKNYKLEKLQRDISNWLGLPLRKGRARQAMEIMDFLKNKSFLLLLDDLWQPIELADLGIPQLPQKGIKKQKVVFTTRLEGVCGQMEAWRMMKVECLNDEEAWRLFQDKVGEQTLQAHARIPQLAEVVAKECDGLPLALVVIGAAMSTKKTVKEWQNAITLLQKSQQYDIQGTEDKILSILKFSYDNLANEKFRRCFLLCSLWPEDHSISKTDLIECWMGHGLVDDERKFNNIKEAYDSGHALISYLQSACLLEPGYNKDREVKMHDVVRDLALWIASDCGKRQNKFIVISGITTSEDSQGEAEKMSLVGSDVSDTSSLPSNCFKLETLMLQSSIRFNSIVRGFFQGIPALTYLDLSNTAMKKLPQGIGRLVHLRYLNISYTTISKLPVELGFLHELRFLLLRDLDSIQIPNGLLEKLVMLSMIDMTDTRCNNWKGLSKLHRLKGVGIVLESIEDLHQLSELPNVLTWRLGLRELKKFNEPLQLLLPSQLGSHNIHFHIQMLKIEHCNSLKVVSTEFLDGADRFSLSSLEEVELKSLSKLNEIVWRGVCPADMLPNLRVLTIFDCNNLPNLSWVIRLPSMEDLTLYRCSAMKQIVDVDNEINFGGEEVNGVGAATWAFPSLRRLCLRDLENLRVFGGSFTFPSLEIMHVIDCWKLKALPFGKEMAMPERKLKEIRGDKKWWEDLVIEDDDRAALLPYLKARGESCSAEGEQSPPLKKRKLTLQ